MILLRASGYTLNHIKNIDEIYIVSNKIEEMTS